MTFQLATLTRRIENRERRLARWLAKADDAADFARIDRLTAKLERSRAKLDELLNPPTEVSKLNDVTVEPDTFAFSVTPLDILTRVQITIVDSPTDDSFTSGDELQFQAVASTKFCETGDAGRSYSSNRVASTDSVEKQVITLGDSFWNDWEQYSQVELSLNKGGDTLASQVFATADIFN